VIFFKGPVAEIEFDDVGRSERGSSMTKAAERRKTSTIVAVVTNEPLERHTDKLGGRLVGRRLMVLIRLVKPPRWSAHYYELECRV
jgi:hypothetical protein